MRYVSFLFILLFYQTGSTQVKGTIFFEEKVDLHRNLPPEKEEVKNMIPQFNSSKWEFTFSGDESLYQPLKEKELTGTNANQSGYNMRFGRENRILYKNLAEDKIVDSRDFMQKQFLIKGFTSSRKWKIGKKQKQILNYNCLEASMRVDTATMLTAWFTPQIALSNGPSDYQGLPGMILQIDINDGERTITATEVKMDDAAMSPIIVPTKGKPITSEEFEKLREEKMKEMKLQQSNNSPYIITRRY
jgi:GLPGLI family protein